MCGKSFEYHFQILILLFQAGHLAENDQSHVPCHYSFLMAYLMQKSNDNHRLNSQASS